MSKGLKSMMYRWKLTLLALCFILLIPNQAQASAAIGRIDITYLDDSQFPQIKLRAIIRDGNGYVLSVDDLSSLEIVEKVNGQEKTVSSPNSEYKVENIPVGIEVLFVIDDGDSTAPGATRKPRGEEIVNILRAYASAMKPGDTAGMIASTSRGIEAIQSLTDDKEQFFAGIDKLSHQEITSSGFDALDRGLAELETSARYGRVVQSLIFITADLNTKAGDPKINSIIRKANSLQIPIQAILVHDYEYTTVSNLLKNIADQTGGSYTYYDTALAINPMINWLVDQRVQAEFNFRSTFSDRSERTVEIHSNAVNIQKTVYKTYQVDVLPPAVILEAPTNGLEIVRKSNAPVTDADQLEPSVQPVRARVIWPDGHPRKITGARFILDGSPSPAAVSGDYTISASWDLKQYRLAGTVSPLIQVQVTDEFGLTGISDPASPKVTLVILSPEATAAPTLTPDPCKGATGIQARLCPAFNNLSEFILDPRTILSLASFILALVALFLAFTFKGQIARASHTAYAVVCTTLSRLASPASPKTGAYLKVLRGDEKLNGKEIPLYNHVVTPVGRSPQEAELVFDMANDRSVVSRRHCDFREENGIFKIRDLGSSHGTYVNGVRIPKGGDGQILADGDQIGIGPVEQGGVLLVFNKCWPGSRQWSGAGESQKRPAYPDRKRY